MFKDRDGVVYCASAVCKYPAVVRSHNDNIYSICYRYNPENVLESCITSAVVYSTVLEYCLALEMQ